MTEQPQAFLCANPDDDPDDTDEPTLTMADVRAILTRFAEDAHEWAGMPTPLPGFDLRVESRYPYKGIEELYKDPPDPDEVTIKVRNSWYSRRENADVFLCETADGQIKKYLRPAISAHGVRLTFWVNTMGASQAWDLDAELEARQKLRAMLTPRLYAMYEMTGAFFESSKRSHITYLLRRARPTVALASSDRSNPDAMLRMLTALCLHPIAYYDGTWAGAMVPTDDVIAHLLMIRADEHYFWRRANHHPIRSAAAGL